MKENSEPLIRAYGAIEETLNEVSRYVKVYKHTVLLYLVFILNGLDLLFISHSGMVTVPKSMGHGDGEYY